ncbi:MAG: ribose 5-phosphate isomerase B [Pelolinea sp.]|nr:ribose 5-phosphate isomerase B [Pelolinea sp.]
MKIAIGSDHVGLTLKKKVMQHLEKCGVAVIDYGTHDTTRTDYPLYAEKVAKGILSNEAERGILICGTGVGMSISANKFHGIRAVVCSEPYSAIMSRRHNDANVLCMGGYVVGVELANLIVDQWLVSEYEGGRHQNRLDLIKQFENGY